MSHFIFWPSRVTATYVRDHSQVAVQALRGMHRKSLRFLSCRRMTCYDTCGDVT